MAFKSIILFSVIFVGGIEGKAAVSGDVTLKIDTSRAQVNIGDYDLKSGDTVAVYKKTCTAHKVPLCKKEKVGEATVARTLNDKYSEIQMNGDVKFKEGYVVEKK